MFLNEQLEIVGHRHFIIRVPVFWGLLIVKKFHIMHNFFFSSGYYLCLYAIKVIWHFISPSHKKERLQALFNIH